MAFIKDVHTGKSESGIRALFSFLSVFEREHDVDICFLSKPMLQELVDYMYSARPYIDPTQFDIIEAYMNWFADKELGNHDVQQNRFDGIDLWGLSVIKNTMVSSLDELKVFLDKAFEHSESIDTICRAYFYLAYIGLPNVSDAKELKCNDVDLFKRRIYCRDFELTIPNDEDIINAFWFAKEADQLKYYHPLQKVPATKNRSKSDLFLRVASRVDSKNNSAVLPNSTTQRATVRVSDSKDYYPIYDTIWYSGVFIRTYELEQAGFPINFSEDMYKRWYKQIGRKATTLRAHKKSMEQKYLRWKAVFHNEQLPTIK